VPHAHYAITAGDAARGFCAERGIPLVTSVHGGDVLGPLLRPADARDRVGEVLRQSAAVLCNSRDTLRRAAALAGSRDHMRVVHLGAEAPEPLPPRREQPTVAVLGHVVARKRHEDVLRALAHLDDVRALVIGDGPERPRLERLAEELGVRVEWAGQLPPADALRELARCHVMALPSEDEAFGVAYVEAMACGLPVIGCQGEGGPEEIADEGEGMLLVPRRDPQALAVAIREALAGPELGEAARRTARLRFSWEECGHATVAAYEAVLER
jgi:glycosyltransferase involved in cell wall biosynthesis